jgi:hypothetical protein
MVPAMVADPNQSEPYDEVIGSTEIGPYTATGALMVGCPACGSPEGVRCVVDAIHGGRVVGQRKRRTPCLARLKAAAVHT